MTIALFLLDLILIGIGGMMYLSIFEPYLKKNTAFNKLKAKEKAELERRLTVEQFFSVKANDEEDGIDKRLNKLFKAKQ